MQTDTFYYLHLNGRYHLLKYKGVSLFGHGFKLGNSNIYMGETLLAAQNPVLWKVKK